jgi:hypothetical protein
MRAATSLHPHNALAGEGTATDEKLRILASIDIVGDNGHGVALVQTFAEDVEQGGFPRADRPADADFDAGVWHVDDLLIIAFPLARGRSG